MTSDSTGAASNAGDIVAGVSSEKQRRIKLLLPYVRSRKGLAEYPTPEECPRTAKFCEVAAFMIVMRDVGLEQFWAAGRGKHEEVQCRAAFAIVVSGGQYRASLHEIRAFLEYACHTTIIYLLKTYKTDPVVRKMLRSWKQFGQ